MLKIIDGGGKVRMDIKILSVLVLSVGLAEAYTITSYEEQCNIESQYDLLKLAVQWGPGFCSSGNCWQTPEEKFGIHGLWPSRVSNFMLPRTCCPENFDYQKLEPIKSELDKNWGSLVGSNEQFLRDEFDKHGSCFIRASKLNGFRSYFDKALELFNGVKPLEALQENDIKPNNSMYDQSVIRKALKSTHGGKNLELKCKGFVLREISFCFDKQGEPIDCSWSGNCRQQIKFVSA